MQMVYEDKEKQKEYMQKYYAIPENRKRNRENARKNYAEKKNQLRKYWIKRYKQTFYCGESEIITLSIEQMKEAIKNKL